MTPRERNIAVASGVVGAIVGGAIAYVFVIVRVTLNVCKLFPNECPW